MVTRAPSRNGTGIKSDDKAFLTNLETSSRIEFTFNPTEYSLSKSNGWNQKPIVGFNVSPVQFTGGNPTQLKLDLFFDTYGKDDVDVRKYTDKVFKLAQIEKSTIQAGKGRPPRCLFSWGKVFSFQSVVTSLSVRYSLFLADGTPVRATMNLTLQECKDAEVQPNQNPTSQGTWGYKYYRVQPQDTIDRIAYQEYGDPTVWRVIADNNNLDNPGDLRPGRVLAIVPLEY